MEGVQGLLPETPKEANPVFRNTQNIIVGSNAKAAEAAKKTAKLLGYETKVISTTLNGEAALVAYDLAKMAIETRENLSPGRKICLISGGETTVTVKGSGKGGRNIELALAFAMEIKGASGITFLSAGTDGTDGSTDAAGAVANGQTVEKALSIGLDPRDYLADNDSYTFFKKIDDLVITGPTGTNVMDIQIILIES